MSVSYTVAAPVWKTTYRAVIDEKGQPFLQGWAIVDNVSGEDWLNVDLSMVSGAPVSFIQNLKQPLYRRRPVIALPQGYEVMPQLHEADLQKVTSQITSRNSQITGLPKGSMNITLDGINVQDNDLKSSDGFFTYIQPKTDAVGEVTMSSTVITDTTTGSIGELFQYHIDHPVTILKNHSALIPIVQAKVEGEAVSIFNEQVRLVNPLSGLKLKNTTGLTLEGGAITVIDGGEYAGEALINRVKPDDSRFISYAIDFGIHVSTSGSSQRQSVTRVKIVNNSVQMSIKNVESKNYKIENNADKSKILVIEHPQRPGYKLIDTVEPDSTTDRYYRFRVEPQTAFDDRTGRQGRAACLRELRNYQCSQRENRTFPATELHQPRA